MGICGDEGKPILLVFDCMSYGTHEIVTKDGVKLKQPLEELSRRIRVRQSRIGDVLYKYEPLNKHRKIRELNLPTGAVITVKIAT